MVSVDSTLCKRNQLEKLNLISKRIESYDAIESNNDEVDKVSAFGMKVLQTIRTIRLPNQTLIQC